MGSRACRRGCVRALMAGTPDNRRVSTGRIRGRRWLLWSALLVACWTCELLESQEVVPQQLRIHEPDDLFSAGTLRGTNLLSASRSRTGWMESPLLFAWDLRFQGRQGLSIQRAFQVSPPGKQLSVQSARDGLLRVSPSGYDLSGYGIEQLRAIAVDSSTGDLYLLDAAGPAIVRVQPGPGADYDGKEAQIQGRWSRIELHALENEELGFLAFDPQARRLYILEQGGRSLFQVSLEGLVQRALELREPLAVDIGGLFFAPSSDPTDGPDSVHLYAWDRLARSTEDGSESTGVVEWTLARRTDSLTGGGAVATLVQTIDTSVFTPPIPDPAGLTWLSSDDRLVLTDSEVNEMSIFAGVNVVEFTRDGVATRTACTCSFSTEPTGLSDREAGGKWFFSDDNADEIWIVDLGPDGLFDTADDSVTSFDTRAFNSFDPEDVLFVPSLGTLFVLDGSGAEVFVLTPGANGVFEGAGSDDTITNFDTLSLGVDDPEGIAWDSVTGHLFVVGSPTDLVVEMTTAGQYLRDIDIAAASAVKPAALTFAPGSSDPTAMHLWIADRGIDNNQNSNENDGRIYEVSFPPISPGNQSPTADAGPDQTIVLGEGVVLDGDATDDGLPSPPALLTTTWSVFSGPGSVTFADASSVDTTATFSVAGSYVLRLFADDSELTAEDTVTVTVQGPGGTTVLDLSIASGSDDAEERASGSVSTGSSDLELTFDQGGNQTVGLRFTDVTIPRGATILSAWVQFQTDETDSEPTDLLLEGEATDDAATFTTASSSLSTRARTIAAVPWSPAPWNSTGERGPDQRSPDVSAIIHEITLRAGWTSGNSLVLLITGTGERVAESANGSRAPELHVEYQTGPTPPSVDAGPDRSVTFPTQLVLAGIAADDGLPDPPGSLTTLWSQVSGPPTVTFDDASRLDATVTFPLTGQYVLRLTADDGENVVSDELTVEVIDAPPPKSEIYVSPRANGIFGGVSARDEDVLLYDITTDSWSLFFDGSDVGLGGSGVDIDAVHVDVDGSLLFSLAAGASLPDVGAMSESDIIRFLPTSTGESTSGSFEVFFDADDVGLTTSSEDVDAFALLADGRLLFSTTGSPVVPGVSAKDEDLLVFVPTSLGDTTSGTWSLWFDGSDVGLSSSDEDLRGVWVDSNGDIFLATRGFFTTPALSGTGSDIFTCVPGSLGADTTCTSMAIFWFGTGVGYSDVVNGFSVR